MPKQFTDCVNTKGAKIRTKTLPNNKYVHGCSSDGGKSWVWGEVKTKENTGLMAGKKD